MVAAASQLSLHCLALEDLLWLIDLLACWHKMIVPFDLQ
jgi:hypothetical protein